MRNVSGAVPVGMRLMGKKKKKQWVQVFRVTKRGRLRMKWKQVKVWKDLSI